MRSAMPAASLLPGKGPTDVDDALHVNQKSDYDMMMICHASRDFCHLLIALANSVDPDQDLS